MHEKDLEAALNNRRDDWQQNLEARASMVQRPERTGVVPRRVDMNDPAAREIRQALLAAERRQSKRIILWLSAGLAGSVAANLLQGLLYLAAIKRLC